MIAEPKTNGNGKHVAKPPRELSPSTVDEFGRLDRLVDEYAAKLNGRDAPQQTYAAGDADRMNPVPKGINPLGTDADYHYRTERNYFLHVERGRAAVRNHPLVEQGINRLIANLRLDKIRLHVDSGDTAVDKDQREFWREWSGRENGSTLCDHERRRTFDQLSAQSFFNQVAEGDIIHVPTAEGDIQTWESHHLRNPWGKMPTGSDVNGIIHGVEVHDGRTMGYWITPRMLLFNQVVQRGESRYHAALGPNGEKLVLWMGFTHRFGMRRGISRLSAPREPMNGFDDLNYANIKSALRRALIAYLMESTAQAPQQQPFGGVGVPQAGSRYARSDVGLGLESIVIEQMGEPAQVFRTPDGYSLKGYNADMPGGAFFEHSALLLTMLAVNLDMPLSFLLLDGSLVNFHGGRMTWDQVKLRLETLISNHIRGLYVPTYQWLVRHQITPGGAFFDTALASAYARGTCDPFKHRFDPAGWPYVKPQEDVAAEDVAERRNLRSMKEIQAGHGKVEEDHYREIVGGRKLLLRIGFEGAKELAKEFSDLELDVATLGRELAYGYADQTANQLTLASEGAPETGAAEEQKPAGLFAPKGDGNPNKTDKGEKTETTK